MPPPWSTNPAPKTESARLARQSFFCDLCQKGYSRINEYEAHEGSYDHQHKKRLKEMKHMTRDPLASQKARRAEERDGGALAAIKPISLASAGGAAAKTATTGFRKGGFRNAFGGGGKEEVEEVKVIDLREGEGEMEGEVESEDEDEDEDGGRWGGYDPRRPTGCWEGCPGRG